MSLLKNAFNSFACHPRNAILWEYLTWFLKIVNTGSYNHIFIKKIMQWIESWKTNSKIILSKLMKQSYFRYYICAFSFKWDRPSNVTHHNHISIILTSHYNKQLLYQLQKIYFNYNCQILKFICCSTDYRIITKIYKKTL